jgi:hypothetical protein
VWGGRLARLSHFQKETTMASTAISADFVSTVAEEMAAGIDRALRYWLGRIEIEIIDRSLTSAQRISAIQKILEEYKALSVEHEF